MEAMLNLIGLEPHLVFSALLSAAVFASVLAVVMPRASGDRLRMRMKTVALERDELRARERARMSKETAQGRGSLRQAEKKGIAAVVVEGLNLRTALVDDETVAKLKVAGFRSPRHLTMFLFARVALGLGLLAVAATYVYGIGVIDGQPGSVKFGVCLGVGFLGFYVPVLYVRNTAQKRQKSIQMGWPDALDLLLICVESGNSVEAAFRRVSEEVGIQSIPLAEELVLTCAELSYLPDRKIAYDNLATRTGLEGVKAVMTALIQAERYGTPLGTALRVMAQENRDLRMNEAEKKAAALPPKLTVPMIVFFLPVLFIVILGPAFIQIAGLE